MHTHPRPPTGATLPIDAVLGREAAHRWQGRGGAPVQTSREWSRHDQGGRRRIDQRISAWLPCARSSRRDVQTAQRAAAGTGELLWARTQLSHTGPVPTGPRGRARHVCNVCNRQEKEHAPGAQCGSGFASAGLLSPTPSAWLFGELNPNRVLRLICTVGGPFLATTFL